MSPLGGSSLADCNLSIIKCVKIIIVTMFQVQCTRNVCHVVCMAFHSHGPGVHARVPGSRVRARITNDIRNVSASAPQKRRSSTKKIKVPPLPSVR